MKRLFVPIAVMAMIFTSCKKYEVSEPLDLESLPTVKLKGTVYAPLDETKPSGTLDLVPQAKLVVRVSVPYSDYDPNNNSGGYYVKEATITGNGTYEVDVPYVSTGVDATISFMDFDYMVKEQNDYGETREVLKHFVRTDQVIKGLGSGQAEGARTEINGTYPAASVTTEPGSGVLVPKYNAQLKGLLEYNDRDTGVAPGTPRYSRVPDTKVTATIKLTAPDGRTHEVIRTVDVKSGAYTIDVPMVAKGTATVIFNDESFWEFTNVAGDRAMHRYTIKDTATVYDYSGAAQVAPDYRYKMGAKLYDID